MVTLRDGREGMELLYRLVLMRVARGGSTLAPLAKALAGVDTGMVQVPTPQQLDALADLSTITVFLACILAVAAWMFEVI